MITIKEELIGSTKLLRAIKLGGHEAVTLWLALKAYASTHPTDGFVPTDTIEQESKRLGIRKPEKALSALLDCGELRPNGTRGDGLVEPHEFGCVLHDYLDHALSGDELVERKMRDRERKVLQRDRARLRTILMASGMSSTEADHRVRDMSREQVTDALGLSRDMSRDSDRDGHTESDCDEPRAPADASADTHTDARAFPSPTQPSPLVTVDGRPARGGDVSCPPDLELSRDETTNLAIGTGMTQEFISRATPQLRARFLSDSPRALPQWKRTLITALSNSWSDRAKRDELLGVAKPSSPRSAPRNRSQVQPSHGVDPFALVDQETA